MNPITAQEVWNNKNKSRFKGAAVAWKGWAIPCMWYCFRVCQSLFVSTTREAIAFLLRICKHASSEALHDRGIFSWWRRPWHGNAFRIAGTLWGEPPVVLTNSTVTSSLIRHDADSSVAVHNYYVAGRIQAVLLWSKLLSLYLGAVFVNIDLTSVRVTSPVPGQYDSCNAREVSLRNMGK